MSRDPVLVSRERRGKFVVTRIEVPVKNLPAALDRYSIVQLTDLHLGAATPLDHIRDAIDITNELSPDLLVFTGDMVQVTRLGMHEIVGRIMGWPQRKWFAKKRQARRLAQDLGKLIALLHVRDGMVGVFGNHDYHEGVRTIRKQLGARIYWLVNESFLVRRGDAHLQIIGLDDVWRGKPNLSRALERFRGNVAATHADVKLLLVHNPDFFIHPDGERLQGIDCALAGHTHGGQIRLPLWGPLKTRTKQKDHVMGLSYHRDTPVYVSNGVGYGALQLRVLCPCEIVMLTLVRTG